MDLLLLATMSTAATIVGAVLIIILYLRNLYLKRLLKYQERIIKNLHNQPRIKHNGIIGVACEDSVKAGDFVRVSLGGGVRKVSQDDMDIVKDGEGNQTYIRRG